jgi:GTP-binding protein
LKKLPRVAVIGRPNVGKSTLFNRITGGRRAIVDPIAGSTRDRHFHPTTWGTKEFELVDTGGLFERPDNPLDQQIAAQVQLAVEESELVCWVVDGAAGIVPEDQALSQRLRLISERVLLVVNKIDHRSHEAAALEFHKLGFPHLYEISAEHGSGVAELLDAIIERLPEVQEEEEEKETRISIVGRPNVGKSSLLNQLVGEERAVVTDIPGTTRDAVDTLIVANDNAYRFVDTAGIRRRSKTSSRADQIGVLYAERAIERAHLCLLVVDAVQGITSEDASIGGKIAKAGRGAVLVFNKWDLIENRESLAKEYLKDVADRLPHLGFSPLVFVSALTARGVTGVLPLVDRIHEEQCKKITTPELNRFLQAAASRHQPRAKDGKEVKLFYMTQSGIIPPRFLVFGNRSSRGMDPTYPRYLARKLREEYGFEGTPIRVTIRKRK